jgi:heterodisulfide reductase subunit D
MGTQGTIVHLEHPLEATHGCRFCWMCRHVCPVGHVTHRETLTPHAWALTIDAVSRGTLQWNADSAEVLYSCADCGMCRTHCVTNQPLPDAIAAARAIVAKTGVAPSAVYALHEKLQRWGNPYAERPSAIVVGQTFATAKAGARSVGLFVSDTATFLGRPALESALTLLAEAGIRATPIGVGRSTGLLASSLGFPDTATALARAVLDDVAASGCRELLVLTPGDRYAFERLYRERLDLTWPADVAVKEVTSVLAEAAAEGRLRFRRAAGEGESAAGTAAHASAEANGGVPAYAYHDPCHAPRIERDAAAPRALLRAALGGHEVRLFWREQRAHPCGAIGGLEFTQPDIAARLADARLADAATAGARWLITDDPGCLDHLRGRAASGIEVRGLYELLVEQLAR